MTEDSEIKSCPFCGEKEDISCINSYTYQDVYDMECRLYCMECGNCEARGPVFSTDEEEVIKSWNKRHKDD